MSWPFLLAIAFAVLLFLLLLGLPVAFCFMLINIIGVYIFIGGTIGLGQLVYSIFDSVTRFSFVPVPIFIFMGEVMYRAGIAPKMMDTLDRWMGKIPGRLSLLTVLGGTLFASVSGSSQASCAVLGSVMVPDMQRRGYSKSMSMGPILGSGGLSIMIPPTNLGIILAALAHIAVGSFLIAIIMPGILMAICYAGYIVLRCWIRPWEAPPYERDHTPLAERIVLAIRYVFPLGIIIFLIIGLIFLGIATPSEAAAAGAVGAVALSIVYKKGFDHKLIIDCIAHSLRISGMVFLIVTGSMAYAQLLSFTGATKGLTQFAVSLDIAPILLLIIIQFVLLLLGAFMDQVSIMMVTIPIFIPIIEALHWNTLWFGAIMLLNMEMAVSTPPFGISLFVMKGVAPPDTTMPDIYWAGIPFLLCDAIVIALMMMFPSIVTWLPGLMG